MAAEQQTLKLAGVIVEHAEVLGLLSKKARQWAIQNPNLLMTTIVNAISARPEVSAELLIDLPPQKSHYSVDCKTGSFDAYAFFERPSFWMSDGFKRFFLGRVKVEKGYTFTIKFTTEESSDSRIFEQARVMNRLRTATSNIAHVAALLERQIHGESGVLRIDGRPNLFFIPDLNEEYKTLYLRYSSGWNLDARRIRTDLVWPPGTKVFF